MKHSTSEILDSLSTLAKIALSEIATNDLPSPCNHAMGALLDTGLIEHVALGTSELQLKLTDTGRKVVALMFRRGEQNKYVQ